MFVRFSFEVDSCWIQPVFTYPVTFSLLLVFDLRFPFDFAFDFVSDLKFKTHLSLSLKWRRLFCFFGVFVIVFAVSYSFIVFIEDHYRFYDTMKAI